MALVFVLTALIVPLWLATQYVPDPEEMTLVQRAQMERRQVEAGYQDMTNFFWAIGILGVYVIHLLIAASSFDMISTSFSHLFSPLIFSSITYFRLLGVTDEETATNLVSGSPLEFSFWVLGVLAITGLVARIRMARHMRRFEDVDWEIQTPSQFDSTFFSDLAITVRPLVYPPRTYRASQDGILIEGWLYILPLSFHSIQSVEGVKQTHYFGQAQHFATSSKTMVRIQLTDSKAPLFISPEDKDAFIAYCNRHLSRGVVTLVRDKSEEEK